MVTPKKAKVGSQFSSRLLELLRDVHSIYHFYSASGKEAGKLEIEKFALNLCACRMADVMKNVASWYLVTGSATYKFLGVFAGAHKTVTSLRRLANSGCGPRHPHC